MVNFLSSMNDAAESCRSAVATPITLTRSPARSANCWMAGSSVRHGSHQAAHRFTIVGLLSAPRDAGAPPSKQVNWTDATAEAPDGADPAGRHGGPTERLAPGDEQPDTSAAKTSSAKPSRRVTPRPRPEDSRPTGRGPLRRARPPADPSAA